jgi:cytochrome-b5 reductase
MCAPGVGANGADVVRPYTPISSNEMRGKFQLLIKRYEGGLVSSFIHSLPVGEKVQFKHVAFNIKLQYPFKMPLTKKPLRTISMIAGGTGITPMYQALQQLLRSGAGDRAEVVLLYGNRTEEDILLRQALQEYVQHDSAYLKTFNYVEVLSRERYGSASASASAWQGERGRIDEAMIKKYCFPPSSDTCVFVCGPSAMYDDCCGPRSDKELQAGTVLHRLGYTSAMVYKV